MDQTGGYALASDEIWDWNDRTKSWQTTRNKWWERAAQKCRWTLMPKRETPNQSEMVLFVSIQSLHFYTNTIRLQTSKFPEETGNFWYRLHCIIFGEKVQRKFLNVLNLWKQRGGFLKNLFIFSEKQYIYTDFFMNTCIQSKKWLKKADWFYTMLIRQERRMWILTRQNFQNN